MNYHLAQVNVARMKGSAENRVMAGMMTRMEEINALAEQSPGFIWRFRNIDVPAGALRVFSDYFEPFDETRLFFNMSVWEGVEVLEHFVYRTAHAELFKSKTRWMDHYDKPSLAMWWIPAGQLPTVADAHARLKLVELPVQRLNRSPSRRPFRSRTRSDRASAAKNWRTDP